MKWVLILLLSFPLFAEEFVITTGEWAPFTGKDLPGMGMANDAVTEVFKELKKDLKIKVYPWKRAMNNAIAKKDVHGTCCWNSVTEERTKYFHYTEPLYTSDYHLYAFKDTDYFNKDIKDLIGKKIRIAHMAGYTTGDDMKKLKEHENSKVTEVKSVKEAMLMLKKGRVDIFFEEKTVGDKILKKMLEDKEISEEEFNKVSSFATPYFRQPLVLLLNKERVSEEFVKEYNEKVKELNILEKYSKKLKEGYYESK